MNEQPKIITDQDKGITGALIDEILAAIKIINNIENDTLDELLTIYIKAMCTNILIKTNRRVFVPELKYVIIDLVTDKLAQKNGTDPSTLQSIQSMSEAGRSVNFGVSDVITARLNLLAEKQLNDNDILINKYKLLYKT